MVNDIREKFVERLDENGDVYYVFDDGNCINILNKKFQLHCKTKPALLFKDSGLCVWYKHGRIHRIGGHAIYNINGESGTFGTVEYPAYYVNGKNVTPEEYDLLQIKDRKCRIKKILDGTNE